MPRPPAAPARAPAAGWRPPTSRRCRRPPRCWPPARRRPRWSTLTTGRTAALATCTPRAISTPVTSGIHWCEVKKSPGSVTVTVSAFAPALNTRPPDVGRTTVCSTSLTWSTTGTLSATNSIGEQHREDGHHPSVGQPLPAGGQLDEVGEAGQHAQHEQRNVGVEPGGGGQAGAGEGFEHTSSMAPALHRGSPCRAPLPLPGAAGDCSVLSGLRRPALGAPAAGHPTTDDQGGRVGLDPRRRPGVQAAELDEPAVPAGGGARRLARGQQGRRGAADHPRGDLPGHLVRAGRRPGPGQGRGRGAPAGAAGGRAGACSGRASPWCAGST